MKAKATPPGAGNSVKRMLAHQIERAMAHQGLTRSHLATRMGTSRAAVNRLLDPDNASLTLQTLEKAVDVLGKKLHIFVND